MPNALLVYPEQPPTFWGADYALEMSGIKATFPPLGLLTVAAMFPPRYALRVVDMNVSALQDADLEWADLVFTSTMITHHLSLLAVIERCNDAGVPVVAGGPHPTTFHEDIAGVDHFVLGEVEEIFAEFLRDLEEGSAKPLYRETGKPAVTLTPVPRFDLIDMNIYATMSVQFSRGCPFDCEFCDIIKLYGRVPRTKSPEQVVAELDSLYRLGWRGPVFLVDDNFIGNKRDAMNLLPAIAEWQKARGYPFTLITEASANLALMEELMDAMVEAGFDTVFVGIETRTPRPCSRPRSSKTPARVRRTTSSLPFERSSSTGCRSRAGSSWVWTAMARACSTPRSSSSGDRNSRCPPLPVDRPEGHRHVRAHEVGEAASGDADRHQRHVSQLQDGDGLQDID